MKKSRPDYNKEKVYLDPCVVDTYDSRLYFGRSKGRFLEEELLMIRDWFPKKGKVLDIPSGTGKLALLFKDQAEVELIGADISEKMLEKAAMKGRYNSLKKENLASLSFPDAAFDVIYVSRFFMLFEDISPFLREIRRVLSHNGILIFDTIRRSIHNTLHRLKGTSEGWNYPRSTKQILSILEKNKFSVLDRRSHFLISTGIMNRLPVGLFNGLIALEKALPEGCRIMEFYKVTKS
jgi:ubiquinone/menaquinone biosynthesis C-methylase UbiE